jgi:signal transduction histidine kinase
MPEGSSAWPLADPAHLSSTGGEVIPDAPSIATIEGRHRAILAAHPDGVLLLRADGTVLELHAPPGAGLYPAAALAPSYALTDLLPEGVSQQILEHACRALATRTPQRCQYTTSGAEGVEHFEARLVPSGPEEVVAILRNVTPQWAIEKKLEAYSRELERSNRELQDFAHVASHDLQEPLRKIQAFGDRLKARYADALDEPGRDYLDRMHGAAARMQRLIRDLLAFARVGTRSRSFVRVDLATVAAEVVLDLQVQIERTGGTVTVGSLPSLDADPVQMRQLLQNLIGNALKFHRAEHPPVVRLSAEACGEMVELRIEDEGIGFDEQYLDRIFSPFERLHGRNEYDGTGMGLAICRKIAHLHGGELTAAATPSGGATFVVTLPRTHGPSGGTP